MRKRAFTLIELLVVMAIIALLISLLLPALAKARATAKLIKDGTQIKQVHEAWAIYAGEHKDDFPTPGLVNRKSINIGGVTQDIPGRGAEELSFNTSQNVHSLAIMQNYYTPEIVVGPTEPNGNIVVKSDYNWELYDVTEDIYWDPSFMGDIQQLCHFSYASIPVFGRRKKLQWKNSYDSKFAAISNRGIEGGETLPSHITYEIHGARKQWQGNICYNDNHVSVEETFWPEGVEFQQGGETIPDNLFDSQSADASSPEGYDIFMCIVSELADDIESPSPVFEWDGGTNTP